MKMQLPRYADCAVGCGKTISGRKIEELVRYIIGKFSEEGLSSAEAVHVLELTKEAVGSCNKITKMDGDESHERICTCEDGYFFEQNKNDAGGATKIIHRDLHG